MISIGTTFFALMVSHGAKPQVFAPRRHSWTEALAAIRSVETGGSPNQGRGAKGDGGNALGPFQVWKPYWIDAAARDATVRAGSYSDCLHDLDYSRLVVRAYMDRYAREALRRLESKAGGSLADLEVVARIHNGGPRANRAERLKFTDRYWAKVKKEVTR